MQEWYKQKMIDTNNAFIPIEEARKKRNKNKFKTPVKDRKFKQIWPASAGFFSSIVCQFDSFYGDDTVMDRIRDRYVMLDSIGDGAVMDRIL